MEVASGDTVWLLVVATAALGLVELTKRQEPQAHFFAILVAWVVVVSALLWVAIG